MRKPQPERFEPNYTRRKGPEPEEIDLSGVVPIKPKARDGKQPGNHEATTPRDHDTVVSRYHDTVVEAIRKAVKEFGKEAATHRFTVEEKQAIADIIYSYKRHGITTSENEISRIAVNYAIRDYRENGERSLLDRVLKALNE